MPATDKVALMTTGFLLVGFVARAEEPKVTLPNGKWQLVFQDEFARTDKDLDENWEFQNGPSGHILCSRWRENVAVGDGILKLIAKKEKRGGQDWTAANMWTRRKFQYGYFECRYKYAPATGTNNSFWIMTRDIPKDAPGRFEIDINEGHYPNEVNMNLHNWSGKHWARGGRWYYGKAPGNKQEDAGLEFVLKQPITATKLRLRSNDGLIRLMEFRAFAPSKVGYPSIFPNTIEAQPEFDNVCAGATAEASSSWDDKYTADKAIDGKLGIPSRWVSGRKDDAPQLTITLPDEREIGCIQFITGWRDKAGWRDMIQDFAVDYWDGSSWQPVPGANSSNLQKAEEQIDGPPNLGESFHVYSLLWTEKELIYYFDGQEIRRTENDICHGPAPVWLSLAIIQWAGTVTDAIDGTSMDVDYVRVYQMDEPE